jgi:hypothetical protein
MKIRERYVVKSIVMIGSLARTLMWGNEGVQVTTIRLVKKINAILKLEVV